MFSDMGYLKILFLYGVNEIIITCMGLINQTHKTNFLSIGVIPVYYFIRLTELSLDLFLFCAWKQNVI
jgi:hypothetical protein